MSLSMVFIQSTKTAQKNFQAVLVGQTKYNHKSSMTFNKYTKVFILINSLFQPQLEKFQSFAIWQTISALYKQVFSSESIFLKCMSYRFQEDQRLNFHLPDSSNVIYNRVKFVTFSVYCK